MFLTDMALAEGTAEYRMTLGGRFPAAEIRWRVDRPAGHDNFKKKHGGIWIDNVGSCIAALEGLTDRTGTTLTCSGKMDDPMTGEKDRKVTCVTRWVDADTRVFESYDLSAYGEKKPVLQFMYTRKKQ